MGKQDYNVLVTHLVKNQGLTIKMIPIFLCFENLLFIKLKRGFQVRFSSITVPTMCILYLFLMTLLFKINLIHVFMVIEIDCHDGVRNLELPKRKFLDLPL